MDGETSFVQPTWEEETSKKSKPSPFYISFIIGDKLVHNCMIDFGANNSMMPRFVDDLLGIKYELISKGVVHLDGISVPIVGVFKNIKMELHPCLGCTII